MNRGQKQTGFTIVELLIVIVVIAILAAITIVAFNGVQQRAKATALSDGVEKVEKAFRLWAVNDGLSTWPVYGNNPTIASLISTTIMKNYLQNTPLISGQTDANWYYDNDGDSRTTACGYGTQGANVFISGVDQALAQQVDDNIDDGALNCGKIRYTGSNLWLTIDEDQTVDQ